MMDARKYDELISDMIKLMTKWGIWEDNSIYHAGKLYTPNADPVEKEMNIDTGNDFKSLLCFSFNHEKLDSLFGDITKFTVIEELSLESKMKLVELLPQLMGLYDSEIEMMLERPDLHPYLPQVSEYDSVEEYKLIRDSILEETRIKYIERLEGRVPIMCEFFEEVDGLAEKYGLVCAYYGNMTYILGERA